VYTEKGVLLLHCANIFLECGYVHKVFFIFCYRTNVSRSVPSPFHLCQSSEQDTIHVICAADQKDISCLLLVAASVAVLGELMNSVL